LLRNLEAKVFEEEEVIEDRMDRRGVLMAEARTDMTLDMQCLLQKKIRVSTAVVQAMAARGRGAGGAGSARWWGKFAGLTK